MKQKLENYEEVCPKCGGSGIGDNIYKHGGNFSSTLKSSCCVSSENLSWTVPEYLNEAPSNKVYLSSSCFSSTISCDVCGGTGKIDWIDKIKKGIKDE